ncbi:MAG: ribosomal-processing cysteine protease Prp [Clostridia bacterium]|nr:ribosomal-processing cysteine protease Prp [Clostridia bacterium]
MVNITMTHSENTLFLKVEGHAGQAEKGCDIVCASVSVLVYTLAQYVKWMYERHELKRSPLIELEEGNAQVVARPKAEFMAEGLHAFFVASVGFDLLARNYPDYITFNGLKEA